MKSTLTFTKIKQQPHIRKVGLHTQKVAQRANGAVKKQVQHEMTASLVGKGKTARAYTTHSFTHNARTTNYTYGAGKGKVTVGLSHHANGKLVSSHAYNVNLRKVGMGGAVAYGGYKAFQHRDQIKAKAQNFGEHVHNTFHQTKNAVGAHTL